MSELAFPKIKPKVSAPKPPPRPAAKEREVLAILFQRGMAVVCGCGCEVSLSASDIRYDPTRDCYVRLACYKGPPRVRALVEAYTLDVLFRQGARIPCGECRHLLERKNMERDHIVARIFGGKDTVDNQEYICSIPCHNDRTRRTVKANAKGKRIRGETGQQKKVKIKSAGFPKDRPSPKIKSRGFRKDMKAKIGGGAVPR